VIEKLAQSGEQWQSPITMLMLSRLQWEVGWAQGSDLSGAARSGRDSDNVLLWGQTTFDVLWLSKTLRPIIRRALISYTPPVILTEGRFFCDTVYGQALRQRNPRSSQPILIFDLLQTTL